MTMFATHKEMQFSELPKDSVFIVVDDSEVGLPSPTYLWLSSIIIVPNTALTMHRIERQFLPNMQCLLIGEADNWREFNNVAAEFFMAVNRRQREFHPFKGLAQILTSMSEDDRHVFSNSFAMFSTPDDQALLASEIQRITASTI